MTNPLILSGLLLLVVFLIEKTKSYRVFNWLGSPILAILAGALLSNFGVVPHSSEETKIYGFILTYIAPAAIFLLLLQVHLGKLLDAGMDMLVIFGLAVIGVVLGAALFFFIIDGKISYQPSDAVVAGMLVAGHIGGSLNFNAVGLHYDIARNADAFAALLTVDHIMIVFWMIITVIIPKFQKTDNPVIIARQEKEWSDEKNADETINAGSFALLGVILTACLLFSAWISDFSQASGIQMPAILVISALALIVAHTPLMKYVSGQDTLGQLFVYLFLIVIGAHTDFSTLIQYGHIALYMLMYISLIFLVHACFVLLLGRLFVKDLGIIALGSQACIGGPVSAAALAETIGRTDLTLPSVLVGSLGGGIGTFVGFAMVFWL